MSNNDVKTDVEEKQVHSGKKNSERNSSKSTHDERNKKTQHARQTGAGKDSRTGRHGNGGRDSAHSHKHRRDTSDHPNSKHRNKDSSSGQMWAGHNRTDKFSSTGEGSHGRHRVPSKNKTPLEAKDSGISIDESSSPEQQLPHKQKTQTTTTPGDDSESPLVVAIGNGGSHTNTESPKDDGKERDGDKQPNKENEARLPRHVYSRNDLLSLRDCAASVSCPVFDGAIIELLRDVPKSSTGGDVKETLLEQEDLSKQVNSLSTPNKEHQQDPKGNTKVSLMPQRRSFGSGCSWRDSTPLSKHTTDEGHKGEERTSDVPWSVAGQQGTHPPKVIDHVPFRSRGGRDWKSNKGSNWKDKEFHEEEDEPEWMSFGPDDKYEFMELKGIEEHEMEREARRETGMKEREGRGEESPISPCLDKYDPKNELVDSGLPSSYHNEDEEGYMLEGFDFKSVLSICQELASDDSEDDKVDKDSLYKAKDTYELKNALISVLGISREEQVIKDHAHLTGPPGAPRPQHVKKPLTLDEIEGQTSGHAQSQDSDQSAFNKFIASMAPPSPQSPPNVHNTRNSVGDEFGLGPRPLKAPPKSSNRFIPTDNQSFQDFPSHYQASHSPRSPFFPSNAQFGSPRTNDSHAHVNHTSSSQPHPSLGWNPASSWEGGAETHSKPHLNPSPSSIGMFPHHMKHSLSGGGGAGSSWVSEMEQVRLSELKHQQQQHQYQQAQQARLMHHQHQMSMPPPPPSQKPTGHTPSLGFLPTSVMRHMHNSKPNQSIKNITRSHVPTERSDDDYMQHQSLEMGGYQSRPSSEGPHYPVGGVYSAHHHRYPGQYHSSYWPNIRGDVGQGYHTHQPRPPVQQQFMRMGSSPVKPGLY